MTRMLKAVSAIVMAAGLAVSVSSAEPVRYEAEAARLEHGSGQAGGIGTNAAASGGSFVIMRESNLFFDVDVASGGFYTLRVGYANDYGSSKDQNILINGNSAGTVTFELSVPFVTLTLAAKVRLEAGANVIGITHNWGWIDVDYLEISPFEDETTLDISKNLVTPNASENARKMYRFIRENFTRKTISGVMSNAGDNINHSSSITSITEVAHIMSVSGNKIPALIGFDIMHGTGKAVDEGNQWGVNHVNASIRLADSLFHRGGIPIFAWHWRDPSRATDEFYSEPGQGRPQFAAFDLSKAFPNGVADVNSDEYKALVKDIDTLAVKYLKKLKDRNVPILWRPLHEAGGEWFWWGYKGAAPCKALWKLMFEMLTEKHGLDNLIWVWTCDGKGAARDWYPGDDYVDIIGMDFYADPGDYGSLMASFEHLKTFYGGKKIIALSENGPIPDPDRMVADEAAWSFFMPWYAEYTTSHNSDAHWNKVMNHEFVITLDDMPGWDNYASIRAPQVSRSAGVNRTPAVSVRGRTLNVTGLDNSPMSIKLVNVNGRTVARFNATGRGQFSLAKIPAGRYIVETRVGKKRVGSSAVIVK